ncbi:carboxypeptidase regulatory-like domain-containing protein [Methanothermobacter sp.]|uniref:carboxypeptidase regulatory-like domain-containing protein n=1 Tax=Methanothermobacter sp. TaxID=1884223 RepID=UPI003C7881D2
MSSSGVPVTLTVQMWMYKPYAETFTIPEAGDVRNIELEHETILVGRVSDPDDEVVYADVTLSYTHSGETFELNADVDEGGYYLFYGVGPSDTGTYDIRAYHPLYRPYHAVITLNMSSENLHDIVMGYYDGSASFTILNWTGDPVQGVGVQLNGPGYLYGVSGSDGTVRFPHLPDGLWIYNINPYGYVPVSGNITVSGGGSESVTVRLIRKGQPVTLQGHVYDTDGNPLKNVQIIFWPDPNPGYTSISGRTDSNGFYIFMTASYPQLVSGLAGTIKTYLPHYRDAEIPVLIGEGTITRDIHLESWNSNITVNVTDINGNPVSGAELYLWGPDRYDGSTGPDGLAVFEKCPPSEEWDIYIYHDSYYAWDGYWYTLEDNQNLTVSAILVPRTVPCRIGGTVVDDVGVPVYNVSVDLYYINSGTPERWGNKPNTRTDSWGRFSCTLYDTTANIMRLVFSKDGYRNLTVDIMPWELPANRTFTLNLDVEETGRVQGYVRNFLQQGLAGITVVASRIGYPDISTTTDQDGFYSFDLPAGNYVFTAGSPHYIYVSRATTVAPEITVPVDFELHLMNSIYGYIWFAMDDGTSVPADGAMVELSTGGFPIASALTDSSGRYEIQAPSQGVYNITATKYPYESAHETVNIPISFVLLEMTLNPGPYSAFYGVVTDAVTGEPIEAARVVLTCLGGEFPEFQLETFTGADGSYMFQSLYPWKEYTLYFEKPGYAPAGDLWFYLEVGEEIEHNQPLEPLVLSSISGTVTCWAGPLQATVVLDDSITYVTGSDGRFEFTDVMVGFHDIKVIIDGVKHYEVTKYVGNAQHLDELIYILTYLVDRRPLADERVSTMDVRALIFGGRPGATGALLKLYRGTGHQMSQVDGALSWDGSWLVFTPLNPEDLAAGIYTVTVNVGYEISASWTFWYFPVTSNTPVIVSVTPSDGSLFRRPSEINITVAVRNDPGNGLSSNESRIFLDGSPLPTEVRGDAGNWELHAVFSEFTHGWHTLSAIAIDNQGLGASVEWRIFVSHTSGPIISNLRVTPAFVPGRENMHNRRCERTRQVSFAAL